MSLDTEWAAPKEFTAEVLTSNDMNNYISQNLLYLKQFANIRLASGDLIAGAQHAKIFSWRNTIVSGDIIILLTLISIRTPSTAAAKINVGQSETEVESDNMIDAGALNVSGVLNNIINAGTNGKGAVYVSDDEWITGFEDNSDASTDLVGKYYIFYSEV